MVTGTRPIGSRLVVALLAGVLATSTRPAAQQSLLRNDNQPQMTPVVLVVHGVGGGNRPDGWSRDVQRAWGMGDVREVTFRNAPHEVTSSVDAAYWAGDWALEVQRQITSIVAENPRRPIVIVSHSWGTVATAMALSGGSGGGTSQDLVNKAYQVPPIDLGGARVSQWVTLGSPLGNRTLGQINVDVPNTRPSIVDRWTNFYDSADPVSAPSKNLEGAQNVEVFRSGRWWDPTGISAHMGIWVNPAVTKFMRSLESSGLNSSVQTGKPPAPPAATRAQPAGGQLPAGSPPGAPDYAPICRSAMTAIERRQRSVFGPQAQVRIEWIRPLTFDTGDCVGGYVVWVKRPEDQKEWAPTSFFAETGNGRLTLTALRGQYERDNPDLQWTPTPR